MGRCHRGRRTFVSSPRVWPSRMPRTWFAPTFARPSWPWPPNRWAVPARPLRRRSRGSEGPALAPRARPPSVALKSNGRGRTAEGGRPLVCSEEGARGGRPRANLVRFGRPRANPVRFGGLPGSFWWVPRKAVLRFVFALRRRLLRWGCCRDVVEGMSVGQRLVVGQHLVRGHLQSSRDAIDASVWTRSCSDRGAARHLRSCPAATHGPTSTRRSRRDLSHYAPMLSAHLPAPALPRNDAHPRVLPRLGRGEDGGGSARSVLHVQPSSSGRDGPAGPATQLPARAPPILRKGHERVARPVGKPLERGAVQRDSSRGRARCRRQDRLRSRQPRRGGPRGAAGRMAGTFRLASRRARGRPTGRILPSRGLPRNGPSAGTPPRTDRDLVGTAVGGARKHGRRQQGSKRALENARRRPSISGEGCRAGPVFRRARALVRAQECSRPYHRCEKPGCTRNVSAAPKGLSHGLSARTRWLEGGRPHCRLPCWHLVDAGASRRRLCAEHRGRVSHRQNVKESTRKHPFQPAVGETPLGGG